MTAPNPPCKRILVIAQRVPYPPNKGEKLRTYYQIRWLTEQGYQVTVAAPLANGQDEADLSKLKQTLPVQTLQAKLNSKLLRLAFGLLRGRSLSEANFYSAALHERITSALNSQTFDVLMLSASSLYRYSRQAPCAVVTDFMDLDSEKWLQYSEKSSWPMRWLYRREARTVAALEAKSVADHAACFLISEAEVNQLATRSPVIPLEKVHVLGNGIDTNAFYPAHQQANETALVLLFVGVMDYEPNVEAMLWFTKNVWPSLQQETPEVKLVIAGMNPTNSIRALSKHPGIEVTGFVDEILPHFHQATIFIAPFQMARGVQNKVLQAFACGLPTISTPVGIEGIDCTEGVHYLQASSPTQFLAAIQTLRDDAEKRKTLGINAHKLIMDRYAWSARLKTLGQIMEQITEKVT